MKAVTCGNVLERVSGDHNVSMAPSMLSCRMSSSLAQASLGEECHQLAVLETRTGVARLLEVNFSLNTGNEIQVLRIQV
jgi:hypothetical protein